jgi:tungstate transport system ATP-binding protein
LLPAELDPKLRATVSDLPILFEDVSVKIAATTLVESLDLMISAGRPTTLVGPNGCGKTTLLRLAVGLIAPTQGRISWGGKPRGNVAKRAIVFQRPVMLRRSVAANIRFALAAKPPPTSKAHRVRDLLARVGLDGLEHRPARRLSGGQQQRLALARALARDPDILFLDEPTASLDPASTKAVETLIETISASGIKVIMATHDLGQARRLAGDILFLVGGILKETAPAAQFFANPATLEATNFLRGNLIV